MAPPDKAFEFTPPADSRTMVVLSERVAVVETKVGGLKDDTTVIRNTLHGVNNEMSRFVAVEERCAAALLTLTGQMADHTKQISDLASQVRDMALLKAKGEGAWFAVAKLALIMGAVFTGMAAAVSIVWWVFQHVRVTP
jgi:hypothetical protein